MAGEKEKMYEKFDDAVLKMIIYAKAASIEAKTDCLYPESLMVGILTTGANDVTSILASFNMNLDKCLKQSKLLLLEYMHKSDSGKPNFNNIQISKQVIDIFRHAFRISLDYDCDLISLEHVFLALVEGSDSVRKILEKEKFSLEDFKNKIRRGKRDRTKVSAGGAKPSKSNYKALESFCTNLTQLARENKLDPIISRDKEINICITILCRRMKNNPILLGEAGVGKTALVEGIAQRIVSGTVPKILIGKEIFSLNISSIVAGTKYRGDFEERMQDLVKEIQASTNCILFIDEIHTLIGAGSASGGALDASNILKPFLARSDLHCIGATTFEDFKKHFEKDSALTRRFQQVQVAEPTIEQMYQIMYGIKHRFEEYHKCTIDNSAVEAAVVLSNRYMAEKHFPDKAIDCIDMACAKFAWKKEDNTGEQVLSVIVYEDVAKVISEQCNIPIEVIMWDNNERIRKIEEKLKSTVFGQDHAIKTICTILKNTYSGIRDPNKPIGSFVFGGQSGTGKTHMAKEMSIAIFGDNNSFIRLDMSEFSESHSVSKLIGSPPGYVGFHETDVFIDKIRRKPYCIILFDEMEKAHPDVLKLFLQVMSDGVMTDAIGNKVDFKNVMLIMTGNFGMNEPEKASLGFSDSPVLNKVIDQQEKLVKFCKEKYGVEFINRIDEFVPFLPLEEENLKKIIISKLDDINKRISNRKCQIIFSKKVCDKILDLSKLEHGMNANVLDRIISKKIEPCVADALLSIVKNQQSYVAIGFKNNDFFFRIRRKNEQKH